MSSTSYIILLHRYNIIIIVNGERRLYYYTIGLKSVCLRGSNMVPWLDSTDFEFCLLAGTLFSANTHTLRRHYYISWSSPFRTKTWRGTWCQTQNWTCEAATFSHTPRLTSISSGWEVPWCTSGRSLVLVRNSANATWPCCRTGTPHRPANGFAAACPTLSPSGPSATGPAGRVLGTARYCFASSTSCL